MWNEWSIDVSYFPTDEIDQTNDLPVGAEDGDDAKKDLAFLGYTYVFRLAHFHYYLLSPVSPYHIPNLLVLRRLPFGIKGDQNRTMRCSADFQVPSLRNALILAIQNYTPHALLRSRMYLSFSPADTADSLDTWHRPEFY